MTPWGVLLVCKFGLVEIHLDWGALWQVVWGRLCKVHFEISMFT